MGKTEPIEVRTLADWVVRQRLLTVPGVAQVFTMGGGRKQFQVLVDPDALLRYGLTLDDVKKAVEEEYISPWRYQNYLAIIDEIEKQNYWERKKNV